MGNWDVELEPNKNRVKTELDTISREAVKELYYKDGYIDFHKICELPSAQYEPSGITDEQAIRHLQSTGWMQNHDREMYESGLREKLADDSGSYDSLIPCEEELDFVQKHKKISCNLIVEPCNDCVSRQAVLDLAVKIELPDSQTFFCISPEDVEALPPVTPQEPSNDAVSRGVFEQVMWERDVAIDQLKELGYGFGEKPKTGHWIETAEEYYKAVNEYGGGVNEDTPYFVDDIACSECLSMFSVIDNETERFDCCPHCGANMVDPQERSEE